MNDTQEDKVSMYLAVIATCDKHSESWGGLSSFSDAFSHFQVEVGNISTAGSAQHSGIKGATEKKNKAKQELINIVFPMGAAIQAWAATNGDPQLGERVYHSRSTYQIARDTAAEKFARTVAGEAAAHIADLAGYGITGAKIDDLNDAINAYHAVIVTPRTAITDRKAATAAIKAGIKAADAVLKTRMDRLVPILADDHPKFATDYANARIIVG